MTEFKDYHAHLRRLFERFQSDSANRYQQIIASGGDQYLLKISKGKILSTEIRHDLSVHVKYSEKKNKSWRIYEQDFSNFDSVSDWDKTLNTGSSLMINGSDPRHNNSSQYIPNPIPEVLPDYDPIIDGCDPTLAFHRTFQTLAKVLENKILFDASISYQCGGHNWQNHPIPFAFIDHKNFYYKPKTWIDESIVLYPHHKPWQRQTIHHGSHRLNQMCDLTDMIERCTTEMPALSVSARNIESIILHPVIVSKLMHICLRALTDKDDILYNLFRSGTSLLSPELELIDDVSGEWFHLEGLNDVHGNKIEPSVWIKDGQLSHRSKKQNQKPIDILLPTLRSVNDSDIDFISSFDFSKKSSEKILFIEMPAIQCHEDAIPQVSFFTGGPVYREGKYFGYVPVINKSISLFDLLNQAKPASKPIRTGNMAVCALRLNPDLFITGQ